MSISTATLISLDDALCHPNYSYVDVISVVAELGTIYRHTFFTNGIRELTFKDDRCDYF